MVCGEGKGLSLKNRVADRCGIVPGRELTWAGDFDGVSQLVCLGKGQALRLVGIKPFHLDPGGVDGSDRVATVLGGTDKNYLLVVVTAKDRS